MHRARVLVLRACAIGDFVLNLPALVALYSRFNRDAGFTFVGYPSTLEIVREFLPDEAIDGIRSIECEPWSSLFAGPLPGLSFDLAVVWMKSPIVAHNLRLSGISCVLDAPAFPIDEHAAMHLLKTVSLPAPELPDLWSPATDRLMLHPGSGSRQKCWPHFRSLAERVAKLPAPSGLSPLMLVGPNEESFETSHPTLKGLNLREVAAHLRRSRGYIGNDSGITHLAAYLGVPTVALFGPTDPRVWGPWGRRVQIVWKHSLSAISVEEVLEYASWISTNRPT